jgi:hypothetical protein
MSAICAPVTRSETIEVDGATFHAEWQINSPRSGELRLWPAGGVRYRDGFTAEWSGGVLSLTAFGREPYRPHIVTSPVLVRALGVALELPGVKAALAVALEDKEIS